MKHSILVAAAFAAGLALSPILAPTAAQAQDAASDPARACSPTVSAALGTWDLAMKAAENFGEKAAALAREKGREYLLPLLGVDPKAVPPAPESNAGPSTDDVARAVEASRDDPRRRAELCAAITGAVNEARNTAGAGLDALKRAVEGLRLAPPSNPPAPGAPPTTPDGLIKT